MGALVRKCRWARAHLPADGRHGRKVQVVRHVIFLVPIDPVELRVRFAVDDAALSQLHGRAFSDPTDDVQPWAERLARHGLSWVGAFHENDLVGFVHACTDGGVHAFLLDTIVDPERQGQGIGRRLVEALVEEVSAAGCTWLHVDYEPHLRPFYLDACGFRPTDAGLLRLRPPASGGLA